MRDWFLLYQICRYVTWHMDSHILCDAVHQKGACPWIYVCSQVKIQGTTFSVFYRPVSAQRIWVLSLGGRKTTKPSFPGRPIAHFFLITCMIYNLWWKIEFFKNFIELEIWNRLKVTRLVRGDNGGKKGKGLDEERVWMTHRHGQQCGDWLWECGSRLGGRGQRRKNKDNCNRIKIKWFNQKRIS